MEEYRLTSFEEYWAGLPEERRRKIEEHSKVLMAEVEFWNSLPKAERIKVSEKPKVHYDLESDTLWLKNGRPTPRHRQIVKGRVFAFFEADIWYPSAVRVSRAYELLSPFFCPDDAKVSASPVLRQGDDGIMEKCLNLDGIEVRHAILSDYLWIGNGARPCDGAEIADELWLSYAEDYATPVGFQFQPATELLGPLFAIAHARAPSRLV